MPKVTIEVTGNTAQWLIDVARRARFTQGQLAASLLDVARQLDGQGLLFNIGSDRTAPATIDDNVTATVQPDLAEEQRVIDPEGEPGVVLRLFDIALDGEPVALVLRLADLGDPFDRSAVDPKDTYVWRQAELETVDA